MKRPKQSPRKILQYNDDFVSLGTWHADPTTAYLLPEPFTPISNETASYCLAYAQNSYNKIITSALTETEQQPFFNVGFSIRENLFLFTHRPIQEFSFRWRTSRHQKRQEFFQKNPDPSLFTLTSGWKNNYLAANDIDVKAFSTFWQIGIEGLSDACTATPYYRLSLLWATPVKNRRIPIGYIITGRSGYRGYVQRLAVHPEWQGHGVAKFLLADALAWVYGHNGRSVCVNTQETNLPAQNLYLHMGFHSESIGLAVLEKSLKSRESIVPDVTANPSLLRHESRSFNSIQETP